MPHIIVQYREDFVESSEGPVLGRLRRAIRLRASGELSVPERQLSEADFSFMFFKEGPDDDFNKDLQVIILAHADEMRVNMTDPLAESIGQAVEEVLANVKCHHPRDLTYSVSLFLGEMGYFADGVDTK